MELFALSQRLEKQTASKLQDEQSKLGEKLKQTLDDMFQKEQSKFGDKLDKCLHETAAVEQRLSQKLQHCLDETAAKEQKLSQCLGMEQQLGQCMGDSERLAALESSMATSLQQNKASGLENRMVKLEAAYAEHDRLSGLENRVEAMEEADYGRDSLLAAAGFQRSASNMAPDLGGTSRPPRQPMQTTSAQMTNGRAGLNLAQRLARVEQHMEKRLDVNDPTEEALSQLVEGVLKMLQLLGIIAEESSESLGGWQAACADLPRMLDHAWLRLRLPKKTSVLKLLRQKADVEDIRELQADVDALMASTQQLSLNFYATEAAPPTTIPWPPAGPPPSSRHVERAPENVEDVIYPPSAAPGDRSRPRPASAGRRLAERIVPRGGGHAVDPCPFSARMRKDAWGETR